MSNRVTLPIAQLEAEGLPIKSQAFARWLDRNKLQVLDISFRYITLTATDLEGPKQCATTLHP